jgi:hypothetical protein
VGRIHIVVAVNGDRAVHPDDAELFDERVIDFE